MNRNQVLLWSRLGVRLFALTLVLSSIAAWGQVAPTGTVSGTVRDQNGAALPKAHVTIVNKERNTTRNAETAEDGTYRFPALVVGHYDITAEAAGFKTMSQTNLTLNVGQEAVMNFALSVGAVAERVEVSVDTAQVDTTSSSIGEIVDNNQITQMPLNGRNFVDLTVLQSGVSQFSQNNFGTNGLFGEFYSANGAPMRSNMYTLDGAIMGNVQGASASSVTGESLGLDGISEYLVMTNSFGAEYGMVMGSHTAIVTKTGTNKFHGDVFEYLRNSVLDARNYFDDLYLLPTSSPGGGRRVAPFQQNQFGASMGGPIMKDKLFFYGTYEGFRQVYDNPPDVGITPTIPAACHTPVVGGVQTVDDTCDPSLAPGATENVTPTMQPLLALWPLPNIEPGDEFTYLSQERTKEDYLQGRIDRTFSASDSMFGRYTFDNANETYPKIFPVFDFGLIERQQYLTLAENHIFSPNVLNSGRISYSRSHVDDSTPSPSNPNTSKLTGPAYSCIAGQPICPINISSIANFSDASAAAILYTQNIITGGDDLIVTKGKHELKAGILFNHFEQYANLGDGQKGAISISNLHNFLLGKYRNYTTYSTNYNSLKDMIFDTLGFYVSDEYRPMRNLTLNLGVRYEFLTDPNEKNGHQSYFANPPYSDTYTLGPIVGDPSYHDVSPRAGFAWDVFGNGKTALRGGGAILYDIANLGPIFGLEGMAMPPYAISYSETPTNGGPPTLVLPLPVPASSGTLEGTAPTAINHDYKSPRMIDYNLATEQRLPGDMVLSVAFVGSRGLHLFQPVSEMNPFCPTSYQYVPQGCAGITTGVSVLPTWTTKNARLNPFFSNFSVFNTWGVSWYNSLQVNLTKNFSHNLQFHGAYTYAKLLDDTEGVANSDTSGSTAGQVEDPLDPILDWGPSNFDIRHSLSVTALYHLPSFVHSGSFLGKMTNGWWTGAIVQAQTGQPFSVNMAADREQAGLAGTNGGLERMSLVTPANVATLQAEAQAAGVTTCPPNATGCYPYNPVVYNPKTVITHSVNQWFNPNMFALQPVGTIGDERRNILTNPGLQTWNISLNKDTNWGFLGDQGKVEFRAETFNIANHSNFGPAQAGGVFSGSTRDTVEQPAFAGIIATATSSRQIQFALKFLF